MPASSLDVRETDPEAWPLRVSLLEPEFAFPPGSLAAERFDFRVKYEFRLPKRRGGSLSKVGMKRGAEKKAKRGQM